MLISVHSVQLGKLYFDRRDFGRLAVVVRQLHQSCQMDDGSEDMKKGTQLLEVYALEIQMYTEQKDNKKLKALYEQSLRIKSAIPHPLIMGIIRGVCVCVHAWMCVLSLSIIYISSIHLHDYRMWW